MDCKRCRHWGSENTVDDDDVSLDGSPAPELRYCSNPNIAYVSADTKMWTDDEALAAGDPDLAWKMGSNYPSEGGAAYWDGSGYTAKFAPTATFGCTLFEARIHAEVEAK